MHLIHQFQFNFWLMVLIEWGQYSVLNLKETKMKICVEVADYQTGRHYLTMSVLSFEIYAQSWLLLWFNVVSGQCIIISPEDFAYENAGYNNTFRDHISLIVVDCISLVVLSGLGSSQSYQGILHSSVGSLSLAIFGSNNFGCSRSNAWRFSTSLTE